MSAAEGATEEAGAEPALRLRGAALGYGDRTLWNGLDLDVRPGEFLAVLGPNGTGKTSLLRAALGLTRLSAGTVEVNAPVGYVPQQKTLQAGVPVRARDLVRFGVDGHRWGIGRPGRGRELRRRVDAALAEVGAAEYADIPVGMLSGGEQQRVRIAQALASDPGLLLCDEPLLSLDLRRQQEVTALVDARRRRRGTAVVFVTHEINPVLGVVDRVLYLAGGRFRVGPPDEVLTSPVLSELYGARIEVVRAGGRVIVAGAEAAAAEDAHHLDDTVEVAH
ncbi:ABC transporter ATP-binding protein [Mangrovactinospora gilvigrisea]|uniref:ABC transporter ATP-binding protein n=1 Tax=Mangrovactinospora gilvigrisea TaxID=1428644 RepID=A0A1J7BGH2_9ACTN|nr:metal ABC transporter ATP-binding protein [Mangrovactinospora gilvigrisea]OIV37661.1 ABC transporter ATP-binding protein [Mangrovactinospora gilvigrisea]